MVDRTISRLLAHDLRPSINVTVSQRNIADLTALLSYILERDLHFTLSYYRDNDCSSSITDLQFSEAQMIAGMRAAFSYIEHHLPRRRIINSLIDKGNMRAPHHYTCGIGRNYLVINQRGEVAKCQADITQVVTTIQARSKGRWVDSRTDTSTTDSTGQFHLVLTSGRSGVLFRFLVHVKPDASNTASPVIVTARFVVM